MAGFLGYIKCLLAKAWPEPCLRYFSNCRALVLFKNAQYQTRENGFLVLEYLAEPEL